MKWKLDKPSTGDDVWALGHGLGQFWSLTKGIIRTIIEVVEKTQYALLPQTDAVINQEILEVHCLMSKDTL